MLALMLPMLAFAQWRVGVNGGADLNHFISLTNSIRTTMCSRTDGVLPWA